MLIHRKALLFLLLGIILLLSACSNNKEVTKNEKPVNKGTSEVVQSIKTDDLKANIGKEDWVIVDTRSNNAFNGWPLDGIERGGHIKEAVDFFRRLVKG